MLKSKIYSSISRNFLWLQNMHCLFEEVVTYSLNADVHVTYFVVVVNNIKVFQSG